MVADRGVRSVGCGLAAGCLIRASRTAQLVLVLRTGVCALDGVLPLAAGFLEAFALAALPAQYLPRHLGMFKEAKQVLNEMAH